MKLETMEKPPLSPNGPALPAPAPGGGARDWDWAAGPVGAAIGPLWGAWAPAGEIAAGESIAARTIRTMAAAYLIIEKPFIADRLVEGLMRADLGGNLTRKIKFLLRSGKAQGSLVRFGAAVAACPLTWLCRLRSVLPQEAFRRR